MLPRFEAGQFITFNYNPPVKPPSRGKLVRMPNGTVMRQPPPPPAPPSNPQKEVFVLHPNWHNLVHAIDMARLSPAEGQVLRAVMDPKVKQAVDAGQWPVEGVPPYPLIRDIVKRVDPLELIKNPLSFYARLVKPFIRDKDVYRKYHPQFISNVRVIEESRVQGPLINPKPLFHKP